MLYVVTNTRILTYLDSIEEVSLHVYVNQISIQAKEHD